MKTIKLNLDVKTAAEFLEWKLAQQQGGKSLVEFTLEFLAENTNISGEFVNLACGNTPEPNQELMETEGYQFQRYSGPEYRKRVARVEFNAMNVNQPYRVITTEGDDFNLSEQDFKQRLEKTRREIDEENNK